MTTRLNPEARQDGFSDAIAQLAELLDKDGTGKAWQLSPLLMKSRCLIEIWRVSRKYRMQPRR
ncbi:MULTISPECIES: hypothetical protein [Ensifer]|uniref:Uncharacterized protein n=1 Tax=Ensifer adhaerens TaxID=106592 RepID=A0ABY8HQG2_ENSAD|nr:MULTISPECIES: hypothetical protein [Ensifer]MBD9542833.1 hypothetical protein [Ensifer sp. ENS04]MDF8358470.1 hypothetical protein [Ensifer adhaerens]WFP94354.1 hypothetical protein P4B07_31555 [Ensifer adhaerens]